MSFSQLPRQIFLFPIVTFNFALSCQVELVRFKFSYFCFEQCTSRIIHQQLYLQLAMLFRWLYYNHVGMVVHQFVATNPGARQLVTFKTPHLIYTRFDIIKLNFFFIGKFYLYSRKGNSSQWEYQQAFLIEVF